MADEPIVDTSTAPADTLPTPVEAPVTTPTPAPTGDPWHTSLEGDVLGYVQNRGLDKLTASEAAIKTIDAHRNAEKMLGIPADKVMRMPDAGDSDAWGKFYDQLGRPTEAAGYELVSDDANFATEISAMSHSLGLTKDQGRGLAKALEGYISADTAQHQELAEAELQVSREALKKDWGLEHPAKMTVAKDAAAKLGVDAETLDALEGQLGYGKVMNLFLNIGAKMGEDTFVENNHTNTLVTREGAAAQIADLKNDQDFASKYRAGDTDARKRMDALHKIAYDTGAE